MTMWQRGVFHPLQALMALAVYGLFALLPVDAASALGGWLARRIGPRLRVTETARSNMRRVFPQRPPKEITVLIDRMWDNLGRTVGEHPHLAAFDPYRPDSRVEIVGAEFVDQLRDDGLPGIFVSGHLANWELSPLGVTGRDVKLHVVYRAANNPWVDRLFLHGRRALNSGLFPKGMEGAKLSLQSLKRNEHMAMLVDQKMNDGIPVPFLGIEAMTAPAVARLAVRFDCPLVPARVERLDGARFRLTFYPPIAKPAAGDRQRAIAEIMTEVNAILGDWIRERPEQWLWVHNRWPPAIDGSP